MAHPHYLTDELQKPPKNIAKKFISARNEYTNELPNHLYFQFLMKERLGLTIESLAEESGISVELIKKLRYDDNYKTTKDTLRKISLYGLQLPCKEAEILFNRYGFTFERSRQSDDKIFKEKLKMNSYIWFPDIMPLHTKLDLLLEYIKKEPVVTKQVLAELFAVSTRTVTRYFNELSIVNIGSRKMPIWAYRP